MTMQQDELKAIREGLGLTQQGFALALGMSRKAINEMEAGTAKIEPRTERAALWAADGGHVPVRVSVAEMGNDFVVIVTERIEGVPSRRHRVLPTRMTRDEAVAEAKALAERTGSSFMSTIR